MNRREFTRRGVQAAALSLMPLNIMRQSTASNKIIGHGEFWYRVHRNWGDQDASVVPVNNCHEMVQDRSGRLFMIGDETQNNILIYDLSGRILDTWGGEYPYGHGLTLWEEGEEEFLFI